MLRGDTRSAVGDLEERVSRPLVIIVGMMANKDAAAFLTNFTGLTRHIIVVPIPLTSVDAEPSIMRSTPPSNHGPPICCFIRSRTSWTVRDASARARLIPTAAKATAAAVLAIISRREISICRMPETNLSSIIDKAWDARAEISPATKGGSCASRCSARRHSPPRTGFAASTVSVRDSRHKIITAKYKPSLVAAMKVAFVFREFGPGDLAKDRRQSATGRLIAPESDLGGMMKRNPSRLLWQHRSANEIQPRHVAYGSAR